MYRSSKNNFNSYMLKIDLCIPNTSCIKIQDRCIFVTGRLGQLTYVLHNSIHAQINIKGRLLTIYTEYNNSKHKALIGTTQSIINNMFIGVTTGFTKTLQLVGIGYRVSAQNNIINLILGLSHSVDYQFPTGIAVHCPNLTEIVLTGISKQLVGQVAADLRALRPPEPFKGKGIRYINEVIYTKETKKR